MRAAGGPGAGRQARHRQRRLPQLHVAGGPAEQAHQGFGKRSGDREALAQRICHGREVCDRTGLKHLMWQPEVVAGIITRYPTKGEAGYPVGLCDEIAKAFRRRRGNQQHQKREGMDIAFTEVFCGPRALLSARVCRHLAGGGAGASRSSFGRSSRSRSRCARYEAPSCQRRRRARVRDRRAPRPHSSGRFARERSSRARRRLPRRARSASPPGQRHLAGRGGHIPGGCRRRRAAGGGSGQGRQRQGCGACWALGWGTQHRGGHPAGAAQGRAATAAIQEWAAGNCEADAAVPQRTGDR